VLKQEAKSTKKNIKRMKKLYCAKKHRKKRGYYSFSSSGSDLSDSE
jgi:hypothetical protein